MIFELKTDVFHVFKQMKKLQYFKNNLISVITWVIFIVQESLSTLEKALDMSNLSLESEETPNRPLRPNKLWSKVIQ